jgi:hypothetical protein
MHARLYNQTSAVSLFILNGSPAPFACKPVLLLVRHLLQHGFRILAPTALECAQLIVVDIVVGHLLACVVVRCCALLCVVVRYATIIMVHFIFLFLKSNIKN